MNSKQIKILVASMAAVVAASVFALGNGKAVVVSHESLKWKEMGVPGLVSAQISGDMAKGPSKFLLKYPVGLVTPLHYHTADHNGTIISGTVSLTTGGKTYRLGPGSYFSLTGKMPHVGKVEGNEDVVFFIQADGPWDAVMIK